MIIDQLPTIANIQNSDELPIERGQTTYKTTVGEVVGAVSKIVADEYDNTSKYAVGDYCVYEGTLYVCNTAISTAEEWNASHWTATTVGEAIKTVDIYNTGIATYGGKDLSTVFESAADLHTAVAAGDFSKIHIGDYYPITLNGSYKDFAKFTVPSGVTYYSDAALTTSAGTTDAAYQGTYQGPTAIKFSISSTDYYAASADCTAGYTQSMSAAVKMEVAAINPYLRHGDTELTAQHILLCSRDCLPPTLQYRCNNSVWYDTTQVNPWRGSALWETLNNADNGIIKLLEATSLGAYIFKGHNNKGMRAMLATMAAGAASPTNWAWTDRGRLFLPTEREAYGAPAWGKAGGYEAGNLYNQWPIFAGSSRHLIKGAGDGGGRSNWWLETAYSAAIFAAVNSGGYADSYSAANTAIRVPLCFLLT